MNSRDIKGVFAVFDGRADGDAYACEVTLKSGRTLTGSAWGMDSHEANNCLRMNLDKKNGEAVLNMPTIFIALENIESIQQIMDGEE